jgi:hypothetical protein
VLKDAEGSWRMLEDSEGAEAYWRVLKDAEGCWRMLKDSDGAEAYWRMLLFLKATRFYIYLLQTIALVLPCASFK